MIGRFTRALQPAPRGAGAAPPAHRAGAGRAAAARGRVVQPGDRQGAGGRGQHREDPRRPGADQARPTGPGAGRGAGVRDRLRGAGPQPAATAAGNRSMPQQARALARPGQHVQLAAIQPGVAADLGLVDRPALDGPDDEAGQRDRRRRLVEVARVGALHVGAEPGDRGRQAVQVEQRRPPRTGSAAGRGACPSPGRCRVPATAGPAGRAAATPRARPPGRRPAARWSIRR